MSATKKKRKESPYDKLRQKTVDTFDEMFRYSNTFTSSYGSALYQTFTKLLRLL